LFLLPDFVVYYNPSILFQYGFIMPTGAEVGLSVLRHRGSIPGRNSDGTFLLATASRPTLGPNQPPFQWVPGVLTPEVKWTVREVDHSPPSSADVKNEWSYTSTSPIRPHGLVLN